MNIRYPLYEGVYRILTLYPFCHFIHFGLLLEVFIYMIHNFLRPA